MALGDDTRDDIRRETIEELSELLHVMQEMGRRLAHETHGDTYDEVRELNDCLHQARGLVMAIQKKNS